MVYFLFPSIYHLLSFFGQTKLSSKRSLWFVVHFVFISICADVEGADWKASNLYTHPTSVGSASEPTIDRWQRNILSSKPHNPAQPLLLLRRKNREYCILYQFEDFKIADERMPYVLKASDLYVLLYLA